MSTNSKISDSRKLQLDLPVELHTQLVQKQGELAVSGKRVSLANVAVLAINEGLKGVTAY